MPHYVVQLVITITPDIDAKELQVGLNDPETRNRFGDVLARGLVLPAVPQRQKYPKVATFSVASVTVEKK